MRSEINALRLEVKQKDQLLQRPQRIVDDTTFMIDDNDYKDDDDSDDYTYPSHQQVGRSMTRISSSNTRVPSPRFRPYEMDYQAPRLVMDHRHYSVTGLQEATDDAAELYTCLLYTSPSPRDRTRSRMPSSA